MGRHLLAYLEFFGVLIFVLYLHELDLRENLRKFSSPRPVRSFPLGVSPFHVQQFLSGWAWGRFHALSGRGPAFDSFDSTDSELAGYLKGYDDPHVHWWE